MINNNKPLIVLFIHLTASVYFALSLILGLSNLAKLIGAVILVITSLTIYLMFKPREYDGRITIGFSETGKKIYSLELEGDPEQIEEKDSVLFKVLPLSN